MKPKAEALHERRAQAAARDLALRRLRTLRRALVVSALALAAGFAVLAHGATPPFQKKRHEVVVAQATAPARHRRHRHHATRRHRSTAAAAPAASPTPSSSYAAPQSVPAQTPAPAQPQPQAPAAPPAPTTQPPVVTSGGS